MVLIKMIVILFTLSMMVPQDVEGLVMIPICITDPCYCDPSCRRNRMYDLPKPRMYGYNRGNKGSHKKKVLKSSGKCPKFSWPHSPPGCFGFLLIWEKLEIWRSPQSDQICEKLKLGKITTRLHKVGTKQTRLKQNKIFEEGQILKAPRKNQD